MSFTSSLKVFIFVGVSTYKVETGVSPIRYFVNTPHQKPPVVNVLNLLERGNPSGVETNFVLVLLFPRSSWVQVLLLTGEERRRIFTSKTYLRLSFPRSHSTPTRPTYTLGEVPSPGSVKGHFLTLPNMSLIKMTFI